MHAGPAYTGRVWKLERMILVAHMGMARKRMRGSKELGDVGCTIEASSGDRG